MGIEVITAWCSGRGSSGIWVWVVVVLGLRLWLGLRLA
jgi:hypothetical protein